MVYVTGIEERFIIPNRKDFISSPFNHMRLRQYKECGHLMGCTHENYGDIAKRQRVCIWTKWEDSAYTMFKKMVMVDKFT